MPVDNLSLQEDLQKQINAGFTFKEIANNLVTKGYAKEEVKEIFSKMKVTDATSITNNSGTISTASIVMGIVFICAAMFRISAAANGKGNIFMVLGIFTAIGMAFYYFTKRSK